MSDATEGSLPGSGQDTGPEAEEHFESIWAQPKGLRRLSAVNNSVIGARFILTGFLFFLLAGLMAMLMRTQLIVPENDFLSAELYNELFTMHGTVMMFVFAVPIMEAFGTYLIPGMIGTRDLVFPRLSQFAYYCYLFGGVLLFSSFIVGTVPDGGWFMYVPLTAMEFSPDKSQDFWLLGVTFIEVASITSACELIVTILRSRAPGMSLDRMPIFAWYMLAVAFMILFAFPPLVLASLMLEAQRTFGMPFFDVESGGDPLLWQHLFWIFGHPEVYIIFLPGAGLVSAILPAIARVPLVAYHWLVLAVIGTAFLSFGLWVHHMYATGIPMLALSFFAGASVAVAIPSGIQVFAWIATLWDGKPVMSVPLLFIIGFVLIFVIGGLTGVMVAVVPFDWQVHDTYFVIAHFHYVLIGGMVFPLFAALFFFMPRLTGRMLSERLGRVSFWLIFVGFNVTFLTMHYTGLVGMPRRVFTYPEASNWGIPNLISTLGAYTIAAGVLLFIINAVWHLRWGREAGINPWNASSLEWANTTPTPGFNIRSIPEVTGRDPLWDQEGLLERIRAGDEYLARAEEGRREALATSTLDAVPLYVTRLPHSTFVPLLAALATAAVFVGLLTSAYAASVLGAVAFVLILLIWNWEEEPEKDAKDVGKGLTLPLAVGDTRAHGWFGAIMFLFVEGAFFASLVYSYMYLWTVSDGWPPIGDYPEPGWHAITVAVLTIATLVPAGISWHGAATGRRTIAVLGLVAMATAGALLLLVGALAFLDLPFRGTENTFAAMTTSLGYWYALQLGIMTIAAGFALARIRVSGLRRDRSLATRIASLFGFAAMTQGSIVLAIVYLFPEIA